MNESGILKVSDEVRASFEPIMKALERVRQELSAVKDVVTVRPGYAYPAVGNPVPALVVAGTQDQYCSPDDFARFTAARPWVMATTVSGADHFFFGKLFPLGEAVAGWARRLALGGAAR